MSKKQDFHFQPSWNNRAQIYPTAVSNEKRRQDTQKNYFQILTTGQYIFPIPWTLQNDSVTETLVWKNCKYFSSSLKRHHEKTNLSR